MGEIKKTQKALDDMLEREDLKWKQRTKVHWLQNGDRNTKFFHLYANQRKKANRISEVTTISGRCCSTPSDISSAFVEYYQSIFSTSDPINLDECLEELDERITPKMNAKLRSAFTKDEICDAISHMGAYKSLGPDGFSPCFF